MSVLSENRPPVFGYYDGGEFVVVKEGKIDFIEANKGKLNDKTINHLKYTTDKTENKNYIIKFKDSIKKEKLKEIPVNKEYSRFKSVKIRTNFNDIVKLLNDSDIQYIELDQNIQLLEDEIPYGVNNVLAPSVWSLTQGNNVKIAVIDSGVSSHDDLSIAGGYSAVSDDYTDNYGHGTTVTGVISALLNDDGLAGVAPSSEIYAVKIMETSLGDLSDAISGLEWAIDNDMDIVSMSFGFDFYSQIFKEAVQEAYESDILLIAAAGNNNGNVLYPAAYTDVIAVGAVDSSNERALFSSYGDELELVAPGVDIPSTALNDGYSDYSGTSMAAPHVTGVAALIKSYDNSLINTEIRGKLRNDALDLGAVGKDDYYGFGLVQVNLTSSDYGLENESYFYEIFKIINYKTPEEDYIFWLDGTGTIDDVDFSEGYYLIMKYLDEVIEYKIRVDENGTVKLLWDMLFKDDFTYNSTDSDAKVWINGNLSTYLTDPTPPYLDGECYDYDGDAIYEECYYKDAAAKSACETYSQSLSSYLKAFYNICNQGQGTCSQGVQQNHTVNTSSIKDTWVTVILYLDCDDSSSQQDYYDFDQSYTVIDKKQALCTGTSTYKYQGRYDDTYPTNNYYSDYKTGITCPNNGVCDTTLDEKPVADENGTIPSPCFSGSDLYIDEEDILVLKQGSQTNFTVTVHALNVNKTGVNVLFSGLSKYGIEVQREIKTINLSLSDTTKTVSVKWNVNFEDIQVFVDSSTLVSENDESNNKAKVSATRTKAYLNISTGKPLVDAKIEDYLKKYVDSVTSGYDVTIAVGNPNHNNLVKEYNSYTLSLLNPRWGYDSGVKYNGKIGEQPYNAIVGSFYTGGTPRIFVYGNEIEGTIAAVKRLIDEKDKFLPSDKAHLNQQKSTYLGKYDTTAYSIWDFLRNTNNVNFATDSGDFANIVENIFDNELYEESIYSIKEPLNGTELRIKHLGPTYSSALINASGNPVVLAHGIHSDIDTWKTFAEDLSQKEHKNVWVIEPYGDPNTECSTCHVYSFDELKEYYWPALMAGVEYYSGYTNSSYVGYDLGCTVALESLEDYNTGGKANAGTLLTGGTVGMSAYPIDTFVGVACIGNFSPSSLVAEGNLPFFADYMQNNSGIYQEDSSWYLLFDGHIYGGFYKSTDFIKKYIVEKGYFTIFPVAKWARVVYQAGSTFLQRYDLFPGYLSDKTSMKVYQDMINWMNDPNEPKPGLNVNLNNFAILQSSFEKGEVDGSEGSDLFVSNKDQQEICNNIQSSNKYYVSFRNIPHFDSLIRKKNLANNKKSRNVILYFLDYNQITQSDDYVFNTNCEELE